MNGTYSVKGCVLRSLVLLGAKELTRTSLASSPRRNHGYDPADPSMRAIFVAHGPFASSVKTRCRLSRRRKSPTVPIPSDAHTLVVPAFENTEVYGLLARLLRVPSGVRASTNGTSGFWEEWLGPEE